MKKAIILRGLPASGKTTWARKIIDENPGRYKRISKDDLRAMLDNGRWSKGNEKFILSVRNSLILQALQEGYHPIIDDTNLHTKHEQAIRELVKGLAVVEIKDFTDVRVEECIERDRHRQNYVGEQVIRKMYKDFLLVKPQPPAYIDGLPDAIISDLDGTLALLNGRNPYDASLCEEDLVNNPIAEIVNRYYNSGDYTIILVSGRSEEHRSQTERWLTQNCILYDLLYMRTSGDNRKDAIVKHEIYQQHIADKYNVKFVLDDRQQCINLWRSLGLTVLQVADGDY
jgi:predicted kinase